MSIETLLEAAEFLEWRAHGSEARDSDDAGERQIVSRLVEKPPSSPAPLPTPQFIHQIIALSPQPAPISDQFDDDKEKRRSGGAGTREVHNKLEKNRRAHLKECFDVLKTHIPNMEDKKTSNLCILRSALRYIQVLKRKEKEYEHEMDRLARDKSTLQQRLGLMKDGNLTAPPVGQEFMTSVSWKVEKVSDYDDDQASTSTASEGEDEVGQCWSPPRSQNNVNFPGTSPLPLRGPSISISRTVTNGYKEKTSIVTTTPLGMPRPVIIPIPPKLTPNVKPTITHEKSHIPSAVRIHNPLIQNPLPFTNIHVPKSTSSSPYVSQSNQPMSVQVKPVTPLAATQAMVSQIMTQPMISSIPVVQAGTPAHTFHQLLSTRLPRPIIGQSPITFNQLSMNPAVMTQTASGTISHTPLITHPAIMPLVTSASIAGKSIPQPILAQPHVTTMFTQPSLNPVFTATTMNQVTSSHMIQQVQQPINGQSTVGHKTTVKAAAATVVTDSFKTIAVNH